MKTFILVHLYFLGPLNGGRDWGETLPNAAPRQRVPQTFNP
jgi:hypothetical protein